MQVDVEYKDHSKNTPYSVSFKTLIFLPKYVIILKHVSECLILHFSDFTARTLRNLKIQSARHEMRHKSAAGDGFEAQGN